MGGYWKPYQLLIEEFFEWLFADKEKRKMLKYLPKGCRYCELLGVCRDEERNWKCRKGCLIMNQNKDYSVPQILNKQRVKLSQRNMPVKRVVIAGCRDYDNYDEAKEYIEHCLSNIKKENIIIIVSGGARGADSLGERYAKENGYEIERYYADWDKYGKSAGPKRNKLMAEKADYVLCFWDGKSRGTKSMIEFAQGLNKPLKVKKIECTTTK